MSAVQTYDSHKQDCQCHVSMATTPTEQMRVARKSGHAGTMAEERERARDGAAAT